MSSYVNYINYLCLGTFIQQATGPPIVCIQNSVIFNCTAEAFITGIGFIVISAIWSRDGVVITDSTPRHTLLRTQHGFGPVVTGVMVDNTTLDDNGIVYTCTSDGAPDDFTTNVTLNVVAGTYIHMYSWYTLYITM